MMEGPETLTNALIEHLNDKDDEDSHKAWAQLETAVLHATGPDASQEREDLIRALSQELVDMRPARIVDNGKRLVPETPKHPARVRNQILLLLSYLPTPETLQACERAMEQMDTREMARFALERNPSLPATLALIAALDDSGPEFRAGVVNSLAKRKHVPEALAALKKYAEDPDAAVRDAVAAALA